MLEYGLEQAAAIRADMLSSGERRRAELARAVMRDPDLLIWDEPFEGASARGAALEEQVRRRTVPHGRALLLLTQDAALAERCLLYTSPMRAARRWRNRGGGGLCRMVARCCC
ncbi:ABC transporter ATP-binding protein [Sphingobium sp. B2]|uniref:ATP-binding cassette domain-containing protein n=1 Tax=Sphingobium sp. B2 TaxID=2583228 RepID=UPI0021BD7F7F|nr:ABC transporter ATP-binding protein [Sphingobium sp. B2]